MAEVNQIVIYGAGGFAREVAWLAEQTGAFEVAAFVDDAPEVASLNEIPVMTLEEAYHQFSTAKMVGAVGAPKTREKLMDKAKAIGFEFASVVHPRAEYSKWVVFGEGSVVCAGNILTTNIELRRHVQINLDCTIGHDVIMGDYTTLAPGVHVSGWVHFGARAYVGTGAVIINGTKESPIMIGEDAVIGAGACVTKSVEAGTTVVGIPAKPLTR